MRKQAVKSVPAKVPKSASDTKALDMKKKTFAPNSGNTKSELKVGQNIEYSAHPFSGKDDIGLLAQKIAIEVAFSLADKMDELNVLHQDFRAGLQRVIRFALIALFGRKERCIIVPDAVPGFTMMAFKKKDVQSPLKPTESQMLEPMKSNGPSETAEAKALLVIAQGFCKKDDDTVLVIECSDALFGLFPVEHLKDNLKMLGFYYVD